jgi:hypothetical protein
MDLRMDRAPTPESKIPIVFIDITLFLNRLISWHYDSIKFAFNSIKDARFEFENHLEIKYDSRKYFKNTFVTTSQL